MKFNVKNKPKIIINSYDFLDKVHNGYIHCEIIAGMHDLLHVAILVWEKLKKLLLTHLYIQSSVVPGLWLSRKSSLSLALIIDDVGVKHTNIHDLNKLMSEINTEYQTTVDLTGSKILGFNLH